MMNLMSEQRRGRKTPVAEQCNGQQRRVQRGSLWHVTERRARAYFGTKYNMLHALTFERMKGEQHGKCEEILRYARYRTLVCSL